MQLFLLLLVTIVAVTLVDMKTFEQLEQELTAKFEERLSHLEEIAKLNIIRSCADLAKFGIRANNYYRIDPDGPLTGSDPIKVWCEFSQNGRSITEIPHGSEQAIQVDKCSEPGCYHHKVTYTAPNDQIEALKQLSEACEQTVRYDCLLAPIKVSDINYGYWGDKEGQPQVYWDGSHQGQHVCSCFYQPGGCFSPFQKNSKCNCDANVPEMKYDDGTITNKTALPITSLHFGGLKYDMQKASHTLGRLRCWGQAVYEESSSCAAIKRSGQFNNGFYNIRTNKNEPTQLVFCNMAASPGYEENKGQTFIESSKSHFDQVEEDIGKLNKHATKINGEIEQVTGDITTINEKMGQVDEEIKAIKTKVAMRSSFCAYRNSVKSTGTVTYGKLLLEDNNIPRASLNLGSGRYTAGVSGTYRVDLAIGAMFSQTSSVENGIYIQINGRRISENGLWSHLFTSSSSYESCAKSLLLHMEKNEYVSVYIAGVGTEQRHITFCVSYVSGA